MKQLTFILLFNIAFSEVANRGYRSYMVDIRVYISNKMKKVCNYIIKQVIPL